MATRASIKIIDNVGNFVCNIYHHYDGYPEYLGNKLLKLSYGSFTNGIQMKSNGSRPELGEMFNGFGCYVATLVSRLKESPGMVYLHSAEEYGERWEDYLYEIIEKPDESGVDIFVYTDYNNGEKKLVKDVLNEVEEFYNGSK